MKPTPWLASRNAIVNMVLSQRSVQALHRLRDYKPPPTQWYSCPLTRRAAVLILLFPDHNGELKVVLTMRSTKLRSYAGQVALPGGKADTLEETPWDTSRREASEEIGLPITNDKIPGFTVEHLCEMPTNLAKTELGVRPCVAFLSPIGTSSRTASAPSSTTPSSSSVEASLIPRLDPKEVAAVFTAPFYSFLRKDWTGDGPPPVQKNGNPEKWYRGSWTDWHEVKWRMHNFYIPRPSAESKSIIRRAAEETDASGKLDKPQTQRILTPTISKLPEGDDPRPAPYALDDITNFRVFGMTARILVDAARVAYGKEPEFEHNSQFGDEEMIDRLLRIGRLREERKSGDILTREVLKEASKI